MQRIDENTYIDNSLVTCVEYQLFIDEMHELGFFFQPDHWTSHQFLAGKAREYILGVRHSDAILFCEWLTKRDDGDWRYRLPTNVEAKRFPLKNNWAPLPLGYWIKGIGHQSLFAWMGSILDNPRGIDLDLASAFNRIRDRIRELKRKNDLVRARELVRINTLDSVLGKNRNRALDNFVLKQGRTHNIYNLDIARANARDALDRDLDSVLTRARDRILVRARELEIEIIRARELVLARELELKLTRNHAHDLELKLNRGRVRDIAHDLELKLAHDREPELAHNLELAHIHDHELEFAHAHELELARDLDLAGARELEITHALDLVRECVLDRAHDLEFDLDRDRVRALGRAHTLDLDLANDSTRAFDRDIVLDLYIDIFTLQERIKGRSPAFEGIRLVKYREQS